MQHGECDKEPLVSRNCTIGLRRADKEFFVTKPFPGQEPCEVSRVYKKSKDKIRVLSIADKSSSKLWPIIKTRDKETNSLDIWLLKKNKKNQKIFFTDEQDNEKKEAVKEKKEQTEKHSDQINNQPLFLRQMPGIRGRPKQPAGKPQL